ncbi:hypothetical protein [Salinarimonas sp.]|uniref:hypothetical protein n=1 Tax=Salinarimonas sp. TaxID=2766526 RepID=UPI0032D95B0A
MGTVRYALEPENPPKLSDETKARLDAMRDEDIAFNDIPELDPAHLRELEPRPVVYRLDPARPPPLSDESAARWDALADEDIDYSDAPEVDPKGWREVDPQSSAAVSKR